MPPQHMGRKRLRWAYINFVAFRVSNSPPGLLYAPHGGKTGEIKVRSLVKKRRAIHLHLVLGGDLLLFVCVCRTTPTERITVQ